MLSRDTDALVDDVPWRVSQCTSGQCDIERLELAERRFGLINFSFKFERRRQDLESRAHDGLPQFYARATPGPRYSQCHGSSMLVFWKKWCARALRESQSNSQVFFQAATLRALVLGPRLKPPSLVKKSMARPLLCRLNPGAPIRFPTCPTM